MSDVKELKDEELEEVVGGYSLSFQLSLEISDCLLDGEYVYRVCNRYTSKNPSYKFNCSVYQHSVANDGIDGIKVYKKIGGQSIASGQLIKYDYIGNGTGGTVFSSYGLKIVD